MAVEGEDLPPLTPSSYIFVRVLGCGAFGEAVLYQKTEDNSLVVWKEVNLNRLNDKQRKDSQGEIDILSVINHGNIISYYNHFIDGDTLFIEMEYANGGTLHDKIVSSRKLWPEKDVIWYLYQLVSALVYIHQYGIIHRDIKTLNIFLTKLGLVKLGDFGISRFLESKNEMAESIVGTPYYMSPEIMMGHKYNFKSDIWALGCVLYEMLTLTKTYQATNPLKLAWQIVISESDHSYISSSYSDCMRSLVDMMLKKEPEERPTAEEILSKNAVFLSASEMEQKVYQLNSVTRRAKLSMISTSNMVSVVTSKMCEVYQWGGGKLTPQKLNLFTGEKSPIQVSTGHSHFGAITFEKELYTWSNPQGGVSMSGQLGHGNVASYKAPKRVDALLGNPIDQVACGEDFTVCVTDQGALYAFGSDYYGCLGISGDEEEVLSPVSVDFFADHPVQEVACGEAHVMALTRYGDVYTWGQGEFGRLGLGSEDDFNTPQRVDIPLKQQVKSLCAGSDNSFLVCSNGRLMACGSNQFNKSGFNSVTSGLRKRKAKTFDIQWKSTFSTVKPLSPYFITHVASGKTHSGVLDTFGHLYIFGSNKFGQLGLGDFKARVGVCRVGGVLAGQRVEKMACGDGFTVVATNENQVYSWGNGESGRLGASSSDQGKGPNGMCTSLPRAIFGTMHVVSGLSCKHWNTLIIAEKLLNQKTLISRVSSPKLLSPGIGSSVDSISEDGTSAKNEGASLSDSSSTFALKFDTFGHDDVGPQHCSQEVFTPPVPQLAGIESCTDSSIPAWLKQELNEAEVIPFPSSSPLTGECKENPLFDGIIKSEGKEDPSKNQQEAVSGSPSKSHNLKLYIPPTPNETETVVFLRERVFHLELENAQLRKTIEEQAQTIQELKNFEQGNL